MLQVEGFLPGDGRPAMAIGTSDQWCFKQVVVFAEANEYASQYPGDGRLGELGLDPGLQRFGGTADFDRPFRDGGAP